MGEGGGGTYDVWHKFDTIARQFFDWVVEVQIVGFLWVWKVYGRFRYWWSIVVHVRHDVAGSGVECQEEQEV